MEQLDANADTELAEGPQDEEPEVMLCNQLREDELDESAYDSDETEAGIRRQLPNISGIYLDGLINGVEATMTVDSGASETMVSKKIFQQIPEDERPELAQCGGQAEGPSGERLGVLGRGPGTNAGCGPSAGSHRGDGAGDLEHRTSGASR